MNLNWPVERNLKQTELCANLENDSRREEPTVAELFAGTMRSDMECSQCKNVRFEFRIEQKKNVFLSLKKTVKMNKFTSLSISISEMKQRFVQVIFMGLGPDEKLRKFHVGFDLPAKIFGKMIKTKIGEEVKLPLHRVNRFQIEIRDWFFFSSDSCSFSERMNRIESKCFTTNKKSPRKPIWFLCKKKRIFPRSKRKISFFFHFSSEILDKNKFENEPIHVFIFMNRIFKSTKFASNCEYCGSPAQLRSSLRWCRRCYSVCYCSE